MARETRESLSCTVTSLKEELNTYADEMSDVAQALGLRRDAPHRRILERITELRALERSTPPHSKRPEKGGAEKPPSRSEYVKCNGSRQVIYLQPTEIMTKRASCPQCGVQNFMIQPEALENRAIARLPSHSRNNKEVR